MPDSLPYLPSLGDHADSHLQIVSLPPDVLPAFFIPRLTDEPQNPIVNTLELLHDEDKSKIRFVSSTDCEEEPSPVYQTVLDLWNRASVTNPTNSMQDRLMSWDVLHNGSGPKLSQPVFLSQQDRRVSASIRYCVRPPFRDPHYSLVYVSPTELLTSLTLLSIGASSPLFIWEQTSERFTVKDVPSGSSGVIIVDGMDEIISNSFVQRIKTIGNTMRRLDHFVDNYKSSHPHAAPSSHSFIHALKSILAYVRSNLAAAPPKISSYSDASSSLAAFSLRHRDAEECLQSLASLCHREEHVLPSDYIDLPERPSKLLYRVYQFLTEHFQRHSPRIITAMFAYILTKSSEDYFREVCASVGYNTVDVSLSRAITFRQTGRRVPAIIDDDGVENIDCLSDVGDEEYDSLPDFMDHLIDMLPKAKKSLKLLQEAMPDHPLIHELHEQGVIGWIWTSEEVAAAFSERRLEPSALDASWSPSSQNRSSTTLDDMPKRSQLYKEGLKEFAAFDADPVILAGSVGLSSQATAASELQIFLDKFPQSLPSPTPTLPLLVDLVLSPLLRHIDSLSKALLSLFLTPSSRLNLRFHLVILRSFLLLTSHSFKARLSAALFSDSEPHAPGKDMSIQTHHKRQKTADEQHSAITQDAVQPWVVGLASLTLGDGWPPGGTELSVHLRTVIIDTLETSIDYTDVSEEQRKVLQEAESRLGFALRDLPANTGKERWLNPSSIEALDFLYLDYKPPRPLDVLITPVILSRYHRVFAFNLRLMRVTNVMAALFRMTRKASSPLFPTLSQANRLLLHFRFVAHSFVISLSSYVYDKAIGATFDALLSALSSEAQSSTTECTRDQFADIFSLADYHSHVLDHILGACLLRSGQKMAGELLRNCLELVVELGVIAGARYRGHLEEYQAAASLKDLWTQFSSKLLTLIKVLRAFVEKGTGFSNISHVNGPAVPSLRDEVMSSLQDLLVRLDIADWWLKRDSKSA